MRLFILIILKMSIKSVCGSTIDNYKNVNYLYDCRKCHKLGVNIPVGCHPNPRPEDGTLCKLSIAELTRFTNLNVNKYCPLCKKLGKIILLNTHKPEYQDINSNPIADFSTFVSVKSTIKENEKIIITDPDKLKKLLLAKKIANVYGIKSILDNIDDDDCIKMPDENIDYDNENNEEKEEKVFEFDFTKIHVTKNKNNAIVSREVYIKELNNPKNKNICLRILRFLIPYFPPGTAVNKYIYSFDINKLNNLIIIDILANIEFARMSEKNVIFEFHKQHIPPKNYHFVIADVLMINVLINIDKVICIIIHS